MFLPYSPSSRGSSPSSPPSQNTAAVTNYREHVNLARGSVSIFESERKSTCSPSNSVSRQDASDCSLPPTKQLSGQEIVSPSSQINSRYSAGQQAMSSHSSNPSTKIEKDTRQAATAASIPSSGTVTPSPDVSFDLPAILSSSHPSSPEEEVTPARLTHEAARARHSPIGQSSAVQNCQGARGVSSTRDGERINDAAGLSEVKQLDDPRVVQADQRSGCQRTTGKVDKLTNAPSLRPDVSTGRKRAIEALSNILPIPVGTLLPSQTDTMKEPFALDSDHEMIQATSQLTKVERIRLKSIRRSGMPAATVEGRLASEIPIEQGKAAIRPKMLPQLSLAGIHGNQSFAGSSVKGTAIPQGQPGAQRPSSQTVASSAEGSASVLLGTLGSNNPSSVSGGGHRPLKVAHIRAALSANAERAFLPPFARQQSSDLLLRSSASITTEMPMESQALDSISQSGSLSSPPDCQSTMSNGESGPAGDRAASAELETASAARSQDTVSATLDFLSSVAPGLSTRSRSATLGVTSSRQLPVRPQSSNPGLQKNTVTPSIAPPGGESIRGNRQGPSTHCSSDLKFTCRLIGVHNRPIQIGKDMSFALGGSKTYPVKIIEKIDIGSNVCCIIAEELYSNYRDRVLGDERLSAVFKSRMRQRVVSPTDRHVIFAFNWFSPKSLWDYFSLGLQIMTGAEVERKQKLLGSIYLEKASDFLWDVKILKWFDHNGLTAGSGSSCAPSNIKLITCAGFSFGGAISHAFAFHLREMKQIPIPLRVIGMGSPRPGTPNFTEWFHRELTPDSCNIIMYDSVDATSLPEYDPVTQGPPLESGFDFHPRCYLLHRRFGTLRPLTAEEKGFLIKHPTESRQESKIASLAKALPGFSLGASQSTELWEKLHGVVKYYEGMYGLSE